jgi:hypothetical protein
MKQRLYNNKKTAIMKQGQLENKKELLEIKNMKNIIEGWKIK